MGATSPTASKPAPGSTQFVADRLVELCATGRHDEAMKDLYADNARHVEAMDPPPGSPYSRVIEGKPKLLEMSEHWGKTTEVHGCTCSPALVNGDQFIVEMTMDCTQKEGPMAGQRMNMKEFCLYTVKNGKITEAKFFYPGCGA